MTATVASPSALVMRELLSWYDECTKGHLSREVGSDVDVLANRSVHGEEFSYRFLQEYRKRYKNSPVKRVYLFLDSRYKISDKEALDLWDKHSVVLLPLSVPDKANHIPLPTGVANRVFLRIYNRLLRGLWEHLFSFSALPLERIQPAVTISLQPIIELDAMRMAIQRSCSDLSSSDGKPIFSSIKSSLQRVLDSYTDGVKRLGWSFYDQKGLDTELED